MIRKGLLPFLALILIPTSLFGGPEAVRLRILHVNDFHGYAEPYKPSGSPTLMGGIAYLANEAARLRKEVPSVFLAAGDMIQGNPWSNLFQGRPTIEVMNLMGFTAMVLGNHEFDFGLAVLQERIREAQFPILAANVREIPGVRPYVITEIAGIRLAIIGLVTEGTPITTHPKNVEGLVFSSAIDRCREVLKEINGQADVVIVLSHLGLPADIRLAEAVEGIQVIVGGHTHTRIETPMKVRGTLIVQAWEHAKVLGVLDLWIEEKRIVRSEGKLVLIGPDRQSPDPAVKAVVDRYTEKTAALLDEVIGEALVDLKAQGARTQETNLGNLIADILRQATQADAALINGGSLRTDILKGPVRMKDLYVVLPFTNYPVVLRVQGKELKEIFEYALSDPEGGGRYPQVSGVRIVYDPSRPPNEKIISFQVGGKPLDPEAWYTLATNDFLAAGGDGYKILKEISLLKEEDSPKPSRVLFFDQGHEIRDLVVNYIKTQKKISASVDGRIRKGE